MTRTRLLALLREAGVPDHVHSIAGLHEHPFHEGFGLRPRGPAKRRRWEVYFTERGVVREVRRHATEDAACRDLLARLGLRE